MWIPALFDSSFAHSSLFSFFEKNIDMDAGSLLHVQRGKGGKEEGVLKMPGNEEWEKSKKEKTFGFIFDSNVFMTMRDCALIRLLCHYR